MDAADSQVAYTVAGVRVYFDVDEKKGKQTAALSTFAHALVVERSAGDLSPFRCELEPTGGGSGEIGLDA